MGRIILWAALLCIYTTSVVTAQCDFDIPDDYGLICEHAQFLCGPELDGFSGTLPDKHNFGPQPLPGCPSQGEVDNIVWFSFIPNSSDVEILIEFSNCHDGVVGPGLQTGIYGECGFSNDPNDPVVPKLACYTAFSYETISLIPDPAEIIPGEVYYLFLDGYGGGICDYTLSIASGICTEDFPEAECEQDCGITSSSENHTSCTGFSDTLSLDIS